MGPATMSHTSQNQRKKNPVAPSQPPVRPMGTTRPKRPRTRANVITSPAEGMSDRLMLRHSWRPTVQAS